MFPYFQVIGCSPVNAPCNKFGRLQELLIQIRAAQRVAQCCGLALASIVRGDTNVAGFAHLWFQNLADYIVCGFHTTAQKRSLEQAAMQLCSPRS